MRLLLDECVDRRLARDILGHEVATVFDLDGLVFTMESYLLAHPADSTRSLPLIATLRFNSMSRRCRSELWYFRRVLIGFLT